MVGTWLIDTCVLYPAYLRDTILRLANAGIIRAVWTEDILAELQGSLAARIGPQPAKRIVSLIRQHFPEAIVTGHEDLIPRMSNHPKDRHVLAAAIRAEAAGIVTFNLVDFDMTRAGPQGDAIAPVHPDGLLLHRLRHAPTLFLRALERQVDGYRDPRMSLVDLASALERCGCPDTAKEIRRRVGGVRS